MVGSNIGGVRTAVWNHRHGDPLVCCRKMDASASVGRSARVAMSVKVRDESWMPTAPGPAGDCQVRIDPNWER